MRSIRWIALPSSMPARQPAQEVKPHHSVPAIHPTPAGSLNHAQKRAKPNCSLTFAPMCTWVPTELLGSSTVQPLKRVLNRQFIGQQMA